MKLLTCHQIQSIHMTKHIFWIASYPKSGNTLVRSILCSLFFSDNGIFRFDLLKKIVVFEEFSRLAKCFNTRENNINPKSSKERNYLIFENMKEIQKKIHLGFSEDFAFFKTHFNGNFNGQNFLIDDYIRGIIYVYRDPRDICLSWARHNNISKNDSLKFMLNDSAFIKWIGHENYKRYDKNIPVYISSWEKHVRSWINLKVKCPYLLLSYEDLVYDKINTLNKIIKFFENNYNIQISNKNIKVKNIIKSTSFNFLQEMENKEGFNESVNEQFFAVGKKEQWKTQLEESQIRLIENKFKNLMQKLNYKVLS